MFLSGMILGISSMLYFRNATQIEEIHYYAAKTIQVLGVVLVVIGQYLHRCEACNKMLYINAFARHCKSCY